VLGRQTANCRLSDNFEWSCADRLALPRPRPASPATAAGNGEDPRKLAGAHAESTPPTVTSAVGVLPSVALVTRSTSVRSPTSPVTGFVRRAVHLHWPWAKYLCVPNAAVHSAEEHGTVGFPAEQGDQRSGPERWSK
jgi:hypothetical protein